MKIQLDIEIDSEKAEEPLEISKIVEEGKPINITTENRKWNMRIVPEEVIQLTDIKDDLERCPVCGDPVKEIAFKNHVSQSIETERVCIEDTEVEDQDFMMYFHR